MSESLRNIAIIAHVDHGKTTLVDSLFRQSGTFGSHQTAPERAMDHHDLERERGITILAKCTSITWQDTRLNIVDTPGHADFGGEVERILGMVDGVVLLVDAAEGPMPQTKFVVSKALGLGLRPIVVLNKADRSDAEPDTTLDAVFDLFSALDANDEQLDFPILYASGRDGWATEDLDAGPRESLSPLLTKIVDHVPPPSVTADAPFSLLATILDVDPFLGRILTGRIESGQVARNMPVHSLGPDNQIIETGRVSKILGFRGLERISVDTAAAGDIVCLGGLSNTTVAHTIASPDLVKALPARPIDPPTLAMTFTINDSPLAGQDGDKVTSRQIRARLMKEAEGNIALNVQASSDHDSFLVSGRGELQLGVLIETMRREGFELSITKPRVLYQTDTGTRLEPIEEVVIDVDEEYAGGVVETMALRRAEMTDMRPGGGGKTRMTFLAPARGLIGYHSAFLTDTRGTGIMNRMFHSYAPHKGSIPGRRNGSLISAETGTAVAYALWKLEDRGTLFVEPGDKIYEGMIIGEHTRENDLDVNPLKAKKLTNIRAAGKDDAVVLTAIRTITLEAALSYVQDDEWVEVTPKKIRLRKRHLIAHERKKAQRAGNP